jgi:hypothetical protein
MREIVYSAATLAGFIGLACLYQNGQIGDRMKRDTSFSAIEDTANFYNETQPMDNPDFDFLQAMGWLSNPDDAPVEFLEDVKMYAAADCEKDPNSDECRQERAGGSRKQIQYVVKCMKQSACKAKAMNSVSGWGKNIERYIEGNIEVLFRPVATSVRQDDNSAFAVCTPEDGVINCSANSGENGDEEATSYTASYNNNAANQISGHPDISAMIDEHTAAGTSAALSAVAGNTNPGASSVNNLYGSGVGGVKTILVIPNGIPVSMSHQVQLNYRSYWKWFKKYNENFLGVDQGSNPNRNNFHFWFIRQDKAAKFIMKNAAKANRRFPWNRFDNLMERVQPTAVQPKLKSTYEAIWREVESKGFSSEKNPGTDCNIIWFHHYLPQDLLEIAATTNQENVMTPLDEACNSIHIWVGFNNDLTDNDGGVHDMSASRRVINYMQGLLQPSQLSATSVDLDLRGYHFVSHMSQLLLEEGDNLANLVYNNFALDRARVKCLTGTKATNLAAAIEGYNAALAEKTSEYSYDYGSYFAYGDYEDTNDIPESYYDFEIESVDDLDTASAVETSMIPSLAYQGPPNYLCCGIGFGASQYDANTQLCCESGSVKDAETDSCIEFN